MRGGVFLLLFLPLTAPVTAPLRPYPVEDAWLAEPSRFSHQRHLAAATMEDRVGFHVTCTDCHTRSDARLAAAGSRLGIPAVRLGVPYMCRSLQRASTLVR